MKSGPWNILITNVSLALREKNVIRSGLSKAICWMSKWINFKLGKFLNDQRACQVIELQSFATWGLKSTPASCLVQFLWFLNVSPNVCIQSLALLSSLVNMTASFNDVIDHCSLRIIMLNPFSSFSCRYRGGKCRSWGEGSMVLKYKFKIFTEIKIYHQQMFSSPISFSKIHMEKISIFLGFCHMGSE